MLATFGIRGLLAPPVSDRLLISSLFSPLPIFSSYLWTKHQKIYTVKIISKMPRKYFSKLFLPLVIVCGVLGADCSCLCCLCRVRTATAVISLLGYFYFWPPPPRLVVVWCQFWPAARRSAINWADQASSSPTLGNNFRHQHFRIYFWNSNNDKDSFLNNPSFSGGTGWCPSAGPQ